MFTSHKMNPNIFIRVDVQKFKIVLEENFEKFQFKIRICFSKVTWYNWVFISRSWDFWQPTVISYRFLFCIKRLATKLSLNTKWIETYLLSKYVLSRIFVLSKYRLFLLQMQTIEIENPLSISILSTALWWFRIAFRVVC